MLRPTLLLADTYQLEREALHAVLEQAAFEVIAHASTGPEAVLLADEMQPDLVIVGARLPGMSGIEVGRSLSALAVPINWILLASSDEESHALEALLAGASGYVLRSQTTRDLVEALLDAQRGRVYVAPGVRGFPGRHSQPSRAIS